MAPTTGTVKEGSANAKSKIGDKMITGDGSTLGIGSCGGFGQKKCRTNKQVDAPQIGPQFTATPVTPTVTTSPTNTPCPQAFICGLPTTTMNPTQYSEPIAPASPKPQLRSMSVEFYIDWMQVDGIDLMIDIAGISSEPFHSI